MIGLDTNVLVRYVVHDDAAQSPLATQLLDENLTPSAPGFVSSVALVETVCVLDRFYAFSDSEIASVIERFLQSEGLHVESAQSVFVAMTALKDGSAGFADALNGELGLEAGCTHTLTFDKAAARLPSFQILR
jgi:predicted nucleic-acid-binding protein